jgi:hypothetical protein
VQAWVVGDERAETYLRMLAETYLRVLVRPPLRPEDINDSGLWKVDRAALSSAGSESYLYLTASGLHDPVSPFEPGWRPWLSWWLKAAGHWHMAIPVNYLTRSPDTGVLALRLTPPLATYPDTIEVVVTGTSARIRAVVPVPGAPGREPSGRPDRPGGGTLET